MKTLRIFGLTLVTGTDAELKKVEALAYGDYQLTKMRPEDVRKMEGGGYHVHRNQPGGPRKAKVYGESPATTALKEVGKLRVADMENTGDSNQFDEGKVMETLAGMDDKPVTFGGAIPGSEPPVYKVLKKDCQRWVECMEENPAQKLAGCGWSDGDLCDGYLAQAGGGKP